MKHTRELTQGNILIGLWAFAVPLMLGNVMQQLYNLVDTWVVGKYIGEQALAAVGASYTLELFFRWHTEKKTGMPFEMVWSCHLLQSAGWH